MSSVPTFLEKIRTICPQIRVLEFYPNITDKSNWSERYIPSDPLSSFINFRLFSSTTYILEPAIFSVLGGLPHLESLGILGSSRGLLILDLDKQLCTPKTWFPSLKDLRLRDVKHEDIQVLWNQPALVEKLVSSQIQIDISSSALEKNWVGPFLEEFPRLCPHLEDVIFWMRYTGDRVEIPREYWNYLAGQDCLLIAFLSYQRAVQDGHIR
ncbi:hypothetical protein RSAG8_04888, partial [Rhizoctonia solani AG-8 WAC10335]